MTEDKFRVGNYLPFYRNGIARISFPTTYLSVSKKFKNDIATWGVTCRYECEWRAPHQYHSRKWIFLNVYNPPLEIKCFLWFEWKQKYIHFPIPTKILKIFGKVNNDKVAKLLINNHKYEWRSPYHWPSRNWLWKNAG